MHKTWQSASQEAGKQPARHERNPHGRTLKTTRDAKNKIPLAENVVGEETLVAGSQPLLCLVIDNNTKYNEISE